MPAIVNSKARDTLLQKANNLSVNGNLSIYCAIETYKDEKELRGRTADDKDVSSDVHWSDRIVGFMSDPIQSDDPNVVMRRNTP